MTDRGRIESFLYREARLMDEHAYDEWFSLWDDDDVLYWVPSNRDDIDPSREVSIIYDDRARLEERIARLNTGTAWAQDPPSRLRRLIANIEIEDGEGEEILVHSNFSLTEFRRDEQNIYTGRTTHRLRERDTDFKILYKKVALVENDGFLGNLTFLI